MIRAAQDDDQDLRRVDDSLIDRLVEGELPEADRAELLRALDVEPDGWKRCALAFLEAQAWRQALIAPVSEAPTGRIERPSPVRMAEHRPERRVASAARIFGSLAAAVLIAFALGATVGGTWRANRDATARHDGSSGHVAVARSDGVQPRATPIPIPFVTGDGMSLPVLDADSPAARQLLASPPGISDYARQALERQGYELAQDRSFLPLPAGGGMQVNVPLERVKFRYVGYRIH